MTSVPEISARGSLILWAAVSYTSRPPIWQGGREMSAPRSYETNPFQPHSSVHVLSIVSISIYIPKFSIYFFHMVFEMSFGTVYISHFRLRSWRNTLEVILSSTWYMLVCAIYPRSSVCSLHFYLSQYFTPGLLPAYYTDRSFDFILFAHHAEISLSNFFANGKIAWQRSRASLLRSVQALPWH